MSKNTPWDDLPNSYLDTKQNINKVVASTTEATEIKKNKTILENMKDIGLRVAFGITCGAITGTTFGIVEVLKDPSLMKGKSSVATNKVFRFTYLFSSFFGAYHGSRKILHISLDIPKEYNICIASFICMSPLLVVGKLRPLLPYGFMLIAIDAYNEFQS